MRIDGRQNDQIRHLVITTNVAKNADGSALVEAGNTRVLCTATVEPVVPKWLSGGQKGWVTAEYGMLPRSTHTRINRQKIQTSGRTMEIARLIGRSLRTVTDLDKLGEKQIIIDCDVLQADGGTRTASITGGFVALALVLGKLKKDGIISQIPIKDYVCGISVGIQKTDALLDLCYEEDSTALTDMNIVLTGLGQFVEIQGTAEVHPFSEKDLKTMIELARKGCEQIFKIQQEAIGSFFPRPTIPKLI